MTTPEIDPLASYEKTPAVSFDPSRGGHAMGEWVTLEVLDYIKLVQQKDDAGKPEFWEDSGKPKMKAVLSVREDGEDKSLWTKVNRKEGSLFRALSDAQLVARKETGDPQFRIGPGCKLAVRWAKDNTAVPKKMGNHPKFYEAKVQPGTPPAPSTDPLASDPWADTPAPAGAPPF